MAELPSGTVTFLFTDIEGSTRLLKRLGEAYGDVLAEQQQLFRAAVAEAGGSEIDTQGDAFFVVFPRAKDAVRGALAAQRAVAAHPWPGDAAVRVRMGMHTAEPSVAGERYIGLGVHRAARICAAAHGGQILLSQSTYAVLVDDVLPDIRFDDLGEHRLKDLDRPERIFQLVVPDLPAAFPPVRTLGSIEPESVPFAGREGELAEVVVAAQQQDALPVVVADDSVLVREGLCRLLEDVGFRVVGRAGTAEELLAQVRETRPAVAITDIRMPPTHTDEGLVAAERIRSECPDVGVLVLSQYLDPRYASRLVEHYPERVGYLLKDRVSDVAVLRDAIWRIADGECVLDPTIVSRVVRARSPDSPPRPP
jgi:class 3 adenylate cyclase/DNA-binding NarL/FixJ family response regulator